MVWHSHGYHYGIGTEIDSWLGAGQTVVVNGSREFLPKARERYPQLLPILLTVSPHLLEQRLRRRRRETSAQIDLRLQRSEMLATNELDSVIVLQNDGALEEAGRRFLQLLEAGMLKAS